MERGGYHPHPFQEPVFRNAPETIFTQESLKLLKARGFLFIANRDDDPALYNLPTVTLQAEKLARKVHSGGTVSRGLDPQKMSKLSLRSYILDAQENGYEIRLKIGEYDAGQDRINKKKRRVAVFRRFDLLRFFVPDINELAIAGYEIDNSKMFSFIAWGDHMENLPPDIIRQAHTYNQTLQDYILEKERIGYHVLFAKAPKKAKQGDGKISNIIACYKQKPISG